MAQWKFRRRQGACSACEHDFEDGERHASLLRIAQEEVVRGDLCDECWGKHETDDDDLIWWFTHHQENKKRTLALDLATMERLFLELADRKAEPLKEVRYLLCLLLMRKRKLKLERVKRTKDAELLVLRRPRRTDLHEVQVFDFQPERMDEMRTRLQEVLEGIPFEEGAESVDATDGADEAQATVAEAREQVQAADDVQAQTGDVIDSSSDEPRDTDESDADPDPTSDADSSADEGDDARAAQASAN